MDLNNSVKVFQITVVQQEFNKVNYKNLVQVGKNQMKQLLIKALKNSFEMSKEDAVALAKTVEEIFKGKKEIEDMTIDKYARALFYDLQREKLLKLRREEFKEKGKQMRKYYWSFNNAAIKELAVDKIKKDPYNVYKKIPNEAWLVHSQIN